jgi:hypothetical protein
MKVQLILVIVLNKIIKSVVILFFMLSSIVLSGCSSIKWKEEIQLENGPALWFNRSAIGLEKMPDGQMRAKEMTLDLVYPLKALKAPVFKTSHIPVLIDYQEQVLYLGSDKERSKRLLNLYKRIDQTWTIVVAFQSCQAWREAGSPTLPYMAYQIKNYIKDGGDFSKGEYDINRFFDIVNGDKWKPIFLDKALIGRKSNILTFPKLEEEITLVTLPEKEKRELSKEKRYQIIQEVSDLNCD